MQTEHRVNGEWVTLTVNEASSLEETITNEFAKSTYSHKVTFTAPAEAGFSLYDRLLVRIENKVFSTYVSQIEKNMHEQRMLVSCGELQTAYPYLNLL